MFKLEDFNKLYYGQEFATKVEKFRKGLSKIERNNAIYFENKTSIRYGQKPDQLRYHYQTLYNGKVYTFGILGNSDLEPNIILECTYLFKEIFKSKFK